MNRQAVLIVCAVLIPVAGLLGWSWYSHEARRRERIEDVRRMIEVGTEANRRSSERRQLELDIGTQGGNIYLITSRIEGQRETIRFSEQYVTELEGLVARAETLARQAPDRGSKADEVDERERLARRTRERDGTLKTIEDARKEIAKLELELESVNKELDAMREKLRGMPQ